jgi:hypothetical protein
MGSSAPRDFTVPTEKDVSALRALIAQAQRELRLPPDQAAPNLQSLQERVQTLTPFFRKTVPSLVKINEARAKIVAARANFCR